MNLTLEQIEELQQAWKEGMAEIEAFVFMEVCIAKHDITGEVALILSPDEREFIRVLKHSKPSDVDALQAFLDAGGCNDHRSFPVTETDVKGRTAIPVSELLKMGHKKVH
jgi:hypothetical protein